MIAKKNPHFVATLTYRAIAEYHGLSYTLQPRINDYLNTSIKGSKKSCYHGEYAGDCRIYIP